MADPHQRRRLGRTALDVTAMGFGAAPLGGFRGAIHPEEARACVQTAHDAGLRYVDTAPHCGYGRSELICGGVLRELPRDSFVLSTKVGRVLAHPTVASVIPGAMSRAELLQDLAWVEQPIPSGLWAEPRHEGLLDARAPTP